MSNLSYLWSCLQARTSFLSRANHFAARCGLCCLGCCNYVLVVGNSWWRKARQTTVQTKILRKIWNLSQLETRRSLRSLWQLTSRILSRWRSCIRLKCRTGPMSRSGQGRRRGLDILKIKDYELFLFLRNLWKAKMWQEVQMMIHPSKCVSSFSVWLEDCAYSLIGSNECCGEGNMKHKCL